MTILECEERMKDADLRIENAKLKAAFDRTLRYEQFIAKSNKLSGLEEFFEDSVNKTEAIVYYITYDETR